MPLSQLLFRMFTLNSSPAIHNDYRKKCPILS